MSSGNFRGDPLHYRHLAAAFALAFGLSNASIKALFKIGSPTLTRLRRGMGIPDARHYPQKLRDRDLARRAQSRSNPDPFATLLKGQSFQ